MIAWSTHADAAHKLATEGHRRIIIEDYFVPQPIIGVVLFGDLRDELTIGGIEHHWLFVLIKLDTPFQFFRGTLLGYVLLKHLTNGHEFSHANISTGQETGLLKMRYMHDVDDSKTGPTRQV